MNGNQGLDAFARLIRALEPWLAHVVIIGGWAHRLYRIHSRAPALDYSPLMTLDTDVAVPPKLAVGEEDIRRRLVAQGFTEEFLGDDPSAGRSLSSGRRGRWLLRRIFDPADW
jgi:hypothetical protein